jgi:ribosomal protein S18 acetylase RimI-like enzyme
LFAKNLVIRIAKFHSGVKLSGPLPGAVQSCRSWQTVGTYRQTRQSFDGLQALKLLLRFINFKFSIRKMIIREAIKDDAGQIAAFQLAMAMETENFQLDINLVSKGVQRVFEEPAKGTYYVAEKNGKVIASLLTTFEWSDWRNGTILWIQSVYVSPEFRRNGIYKNMYRHILQLVAENHEFKGVRLYVDHTNLPARQVYKKLGMNSEHYQLFEWLKD